MIDKNLRCQWCGAPATHEVVVQPLGRKRGRPRKCDQTSRVFVCEACAAKTDVGRCV